MFEIFVWLVIYVFFLAVALYILYRVILSAINDSELKKEVTELRKIVEKLSVKQNADKNIDERSTKHIMSSDEYEACPACGYINPINATACEDCQLRLNNEATL